MYAFGSLLIVLLSEHYLSLHELPIRANIDVDRVLIMVMLKKTEI